MQQVAPPSVALRATTLLRERERSARSRTVEKQIDRARDALIDHLTTRRLGAMHQDSRLRLRAHHGKQHVGGAAGIRDPQMSSFALLLKPAGQPLTDLARTRTIER